MELYKLELISIKEFSHIRFILSDDNLHQFNHPGYELDLYGVTRSFW